ncbi:hypothetical protein, conserved [Eimeria tenella]|uniref:Uncharacterized protein n=1 Tax=Eimeria tenella TaxID=5802 RepID=U6KTP4_EIMTE|nr:hypothetical protein, conserved [Eimeria tenella]CDJ41462.1 hypothetical protein, conserved [Eimeria tenella]|eukprot:XP_013232212.1 hypothetical protein, conserved [Eimeria tenella]
MNALEDSLFMIERIKDTFQRMQGERQGPTTMINLKTASVSTLHMATKHCDILPHGAPSHGITPPSPLNPLAALAVYIDVNFSAALRMLRTAASAAVEEAKAAVFFGSKGRLKISSFLHGKLQQLWLQAYKGSMQGHIQQLEHTCVIGLQHHNEVAKRSTSKAAGIISNMPSTIHHREELSSRDIDKESPNPACEQSAKRLSPTSRHNRNLSILQQLPASWRPLRRDDGTFVAPPVQLLAAYANDGSNHVPSVFRHGFGPKEQELPAAGGKAAPQQAFECVVGLCVRSLLDLYIQAVRSLQPELLPEGSVILVGAVNVPMMFRVMEEHRLIVQPLDLDPHTLMPTPQSLKQAMRCWGSKAKALVHSHLYGGLCDLQLLVNFSAEHKLLLIEDCAESFVGELYRGHPLADISLFSFGLMKTCTAAGGGIATVRSRFVAARMRSLQALYPFSSRWTFFKKLCVTIGACGLQNEFIMKTFLRLC